MRVRKRKGAEEYLENSPQTVILNPEVTKGRWHDVFGNENPIHIEVGSGKGAFITGMALKNPGINYIGIDIQVSVLSYALDKVLDNGVVQNVKLLLVDGSDLSNYFAEEEVSLIYLNFSDPWPKIRHSRRRLTSRGFLEKYANILRENKEIIFKTDNKNLFEFTLLELSLRKDKLISIDIDLHSKQYEIEDERLVLTEYEKRFMEQELPIYRLEAQLLGNK